MKIDRPIGILSILLQKEKVTAPELAERIEVSRRTINRDIENLCKEGIPISTTQGVGGGIRIHYYAPNGESTREIEPHFLIFKWSSWYVWGWCRLREDFRMFKLTRMDQIEYTDRENLITWMLTCKDQVKVIEPEDVREELLRIANGIAENYKV